MQRGTLGAGGRGTHRTGLIAAVLAFAVSAAPSAAATPRPEHLPGDVVVRFEASAGASERAAIRDRVGAEVDRALPVRGAPLLELEHRRSVPAAVAMLERTPGVLYAEPNYKVEPDAITTNDPMFASQWNLQRIEAPAAWTRTVGSRDVVVAVLDGGVEADHPDLAGTSPEDSNVWTSPETARNDGDGHGTAAAGVVGAIGDNGIGPTGVNQRVRIMPLAAHHNGSASVAEAITYAHSHGVRMANGSFGIPYAQVIEDALAASPNLLLTVSAGNQGWNVDEHPEARYPCISTLPNVICVAASAHDDNLVEWSNFSPTTVDVAAPGVDIATLSPPDRWIRIDDFERELEGRWETGGTGVPWGRVSYSWGSLIEDSPGQQYANDSDSWIAMTGSVDLTGYSNCVVSMGVGWQLAAGDVFRVEASNDSTPWTTVHRFEGGAPTEWGDLTAVEGEPGVKLRFRLTSNSTGQAQGAQVDHLGLYCIDPPFRGTEYTRTGGTSFAAPHVAGVGGLVLSLEPNLTTAQLRSRLLDTVDRVPFLEGRIVTGGRVNARRAVGLPDPASPASEAGASDPGVIDPDRRAPRCSVGLFRRQRLATVARRGLRVAVRCNEAGRLGVRMLVKGVRVSGKGTWLGAPGKRALRLRLSGRALRKLPKSRTVIAAVEVSARDSAGNTGAASKRVWMKR